MKLYREDLTDIEGSMGLRGLWEDSYMWKMWVEVEVAAMAGLVHVGRIRGGVCEVEGQGQGHYPSESDYKFVRNHVGFDEDVYRRVWAESRHDMIAGLEAMQSTLRAAGGENQGRWLHHGLTSSDVQDTAKQLQLVRTAVEFSNRISLDYGSYGGSGEREEICDVSRHTMRLVDEIMPRLRVGQLSGPVGTNATYEPAAEIYALRKLRLRRIPSSQIISRDIHAEWGGVCARVLTMWSVMAQKWEWGSEIRDVLRYTANRALGFYQTMVSNVALWHERDISHNSTERVILPELADSLEYLVQTVRQRYRLIQRLERHVERERQGVLW